MGCRRGSGGGALRGGLWASLVVLAALAAASSALALAQVSREHTPHACGPESAVHAARRVCCLHEGGGMGRAPYYIQRMQHQAAEDAGAAQICFTGLRPGCGLPQRDP